MPILRPRRSRHNTPAREGGGGATGAGGCGCESGCWCGGVRQLYWGRGGRSRTGALERAPDLGRPVVMGAGRDLGRSSREMRSSREISGLRPPLRQSPPRAVAARRGRRARLRYNLISRGRPADLTSAAAALRADVGGRGDAFRAVLAARRLVRVGFRLRARFRVRVRLSGQGQWSVVRVRVRVSICASISCSAATAASSRRPRSCWLGVGVGWWSGSRS